MGNELDSLVLPTAGELDIFVRDHLEQLRAGAAWFIVAYEQARTFGSANPQTRTLVDVYRRITGVSDRKATSRSKRPVKPDQDSLPDETRWFADDDDRVAATLLLGWLVMVEEAQATDINGPRLVFEQTGKKGFFKANDRSWGGAIIEEYRNWNNWLSWAWKHRERLNRPPLKSPASSIININLTIVNQNIACQSNESQQDPTQEHMPASWFQTEFGIPDERLRSAYRRKAIQAKRVGNRLYYHVADAQKLWPDDVTHLPESPTQPVKPG